MSNDLQAKAGEAGYSDESPIEIKKYVLDDTRISTVRGLIAVLTVAGFAAYTGQDNLEDLKLFMKEVPNDDI